MSEFSVGQRWISNTEAALGLGIILELVDRRVVVNFPAAQEERTYALNNAPLSRIVYIAGDTIHNMEGQTFVVLDSLDHSGVVIYKVSDEHGEEGILPEIDLDCFVHFNSPKDRLFSGLIDPNKFFNLRQDARQYLANYQQSGAVGLLGPRVQLLPHQLYIAKEVASRKAPRVLLADEVGLGKTIEAGLIVHQQLQAGLAERVLILVPDSLLHQWLVEMLRRFNLGFSVLDEAICEELHEEDINPFETTQKVLCPLSFLVDNPKRLEQALGCDWDLLLVDEAHHLKWQVDVPSIEYQCVESLAKVSKGVLLLTATPEQLGLESHFARLRLLDPDRYFSLEHFKIEESHFSEVNDIIHQVLKARASGELPCETEQYLLADEWVELQRVFVEDPDSAIDQVLDNVLDRFGTGRNLFRNTRAAVKGFPERKLHGYPLEFFDDLAMAVPIEHWLHSEKIFGEDWLQLDSRVEWLVGLLDEFRSEKILLICHSAETAVQLEEYLRLREGIRTAVFHEGMSLIARDRAAAYFSDSEDSAQILVCSEIGSEGRNFQFAHHIVMFDLPVNPDLLEQRIGRLDRIGQLRTVNIHVPYYEKTAQHVLLDWYHHGLDAFEHTCAIGHSVYEIFLESLMQCLQTRDDAEIKQLIAETKQTAEKLITELQEGRDKLLELNSCRPKVAEAIIDRMLGAECKQELEDFIERSCDQYGIDLEAHSQHAVIIRPGDHMKDGGFDLDEEGFTATFSREQALSREDMQYLSWEHPFVQAAFDQILFTEHGNTAVATVKLKPLKEGTLLLEALYSVEAIAPKSMALHRYLPATHIRTLVNLDGKDFSGLLSSEKLTPLLQRIPRVTAQALVAQAKELIEQLVSAAEKQAEAKLPQMIEAATSTMQVELDSDIHRLKALAKENANISMEEINVLEHERDVLQAAIEHAVVNLDAVRLIMAV